MSARATEPEIRALRRQAMRPTMQTKRPARRSIPNDDSIEVEAVILGACQRPSPFRHAVRHDFVPGPVDELRPRITNEYAPCWRELAAIARRMKTHRRKPLLLSRQAFTHPRTVARGIDPSHAVHRECASVRGKRVARMHPMNLAAISKHAVIPVDPNTASCADASVVFVDGDDVRIDHRRG